MTPYLFLKVLGDSFVGEYDRIADVEIVYLPTG